MQTKEEHLAKLRKFFSGEAFTSRKDMIKETCHPLIMRTSDDDPWQVTEVEAREVLHEFAPALSVVVEGNTMVVFYEKNKA